MKLKNVINFTLFSLFISVFLAKAMQQTAQQPAPQATQQTMPQGLYNLLHFVPTSDVYNPIDQECKALKLKANQQTSTIKITQENAPTLYKFIEYFIKDFITKALLSMPEIYVYLGDDQNGFNASMQTVTYTHISWIPGTNIPPTKITTNQYNLTVGAELVKLFTWDRDLIPCFKATLAHEIGHAVTQKKDTSTIMTQAQAWKSEYDADAFAVSILETPQNLEKAIDILTLSGHIYNNMMAIAGNETREQVLYLVHVLTSALIEEIPGLKYLGMAPSHSEFASRVYSALHPVLNPTATQGESISASQFVTTAYENLKSACLKSTNNQKFSVTNQMLDELTNRYFSPINHPTPKKRKLNIQRLIQAKNENSHHQR